ncbi:MAG TPA: GNAT family protein [Bacteroidales bacterium]|nr:GNAT family protein [Bacteroidales bacterium]
MMNTIRVNHQIVLEKIKDSDAEEIFLLISSFREKLRTWLPFVDYTKSPEDTGNYIKSMNNSAFRDLFFTVRYMGQAVGLIGYKDIDNINKKLEIGYWLAPPFEGKGIVTTSLEMMIDAAFDKLQMNRVQIRCGVGNTRSRNIPLRLHFLFEGIERQGEFLNGRFIDLEVYGLLKKEWIVLRK